MMRLIFAVVFIFLLCLGATKYEDWGFFAHRRINRLAVFTLPEVMLPLFKKNIDFVTEHAVDPDKRRYAFRLEAPRHYLDMDMYEGKCLPENFAEAFSIYGKLGCVNKNMDTTYLSVVDTGWCRSGDQVFMSDGKLSWPVRKNTVRSIYNKFVLGAYYDEHYIIPIDSVRHLLGDYGKQTVSVFLDDHFSEHGLVPYVIEQYYRRLVRAFKEKDFNRVLNISADLGHYVGDAHVPLHACSNYNGQLSDQHGIHAFWESRIPELFADESYDYFVGKAKYIEDINDFAWATIRSSAALSDSVLHIEKRLRTQYPSDQIMCFDERLGKMIWIQCRDYAEAYDKAMDGMVESRMRDAILGVGSVWFSAWVDAGQPDLGPGLEQPIIWEVDTNVVKFDQIIQAGGKGHGRDHE